MEYFAYTFDPQSPGFGDSTSRLFADDGVLIEHNIGARCEESALFWGK